MEELLIRLNSCNFNIYIRSENCTIFGGYIRIVCSILVAERSYIKVSKLK